MDYYYPGVVELNVDLLSSLIIAPLAKLFQSFFLQAFDQCINQAGQLPPELTIRNNSQWMTNLPLNRHNVSMTQLAIPGSHDAFAYNLRTSLGLDGSIPDVLKWFDFQIVRRYLRPWTVTQTLTVRQQLTAGVRYFDIRLAVTDSRPNQHAYRAVHALYGDRIEPTLNEVAQFLRENPREIVLLDFNHWYNHNGIDDFFSEFRSFLQRIFGPTGKRSLICPRMRLDHITLSRLWNRECQILLFFKDSGTGDGWYMVPKPLQDIFQPFLSLANQWHAQDDPKTVIQSNRLALMYKKTFRKMKDSRVFHRYQTIIFGPVYTRIARLKRRQFDNNSMGWLESGNRSAAAPDPFYVSQALVSPQSASLGLALYNPCSGLRNWNAKITTQLAAEWVTSLSNSSSSSSSPVNIVLVDFVEVANFTSAVISLNFQ